MRWLARMADDHPIGVYLATMAFIVIAASVMALTIP